MFVSFRDRFLMNRTFFLMALACIALSACTSSRGVGGKPISLSGEQRGAFSFDIYNVRGSPIVGGVVFEKGVSTAEARSRQTAHLAALTAALRERCERQGTVFGGAQTIFDEQKGGWSMAGRCR